MTQARFLNAIKDDHKNGYWDEFENEFKKDAQVLLNKYDYPNLNKVTLFDLFVEVYETRYGART